MWLPYYSLLCPDTIAELSFLPLLFPHHVTAVALTSLYCLKCCSLMPGPRRNGRLGGAAIPLVLHALSGEGSLVAFLLPAAMAESHPHSSLHSGMKHSFILWVDVWWRLAIQTGWWALGCSCFWVCLRLFLARTARDMVCTPLWRASSIPPAGWNRV